MIARLLKAIRGYLKVPLSVSAAETDLQILEELEFHLSERTREGVAGGLAEPDARRAAVQRFGDPASVRSKLRV
jgi:hypothetical protein